MTRSWSLVLCSAALVVSGCNADEPAPDAEASTPEAVAIVPADDAIEVRIEGFECGDNCYLNYSMIADIVTETQSALCNVDACEVWFEEQAMPPEFLERSAAITLGKGKQYDNAGNIMSDDFPEVKSIAIDPAE